MTQTIPTQPRETARRLIEATSATLWTEDESSLRIADICRATGLSSSVIYAHFGSRQGLVDAALLSMFERAAATYREILAAGISEVGSVEEVIAFLSAGRTGREVQASMAELRRVRLRVATAALARPAMRERWAEIQEVHLQGMAALTEAVQARGVIGRRLTGRQLAIVIEGFGIAKELDAITAAPEPNEVWLEMLATMLRNL